MRLSHNAFCPSESWEPESSKPLTPQGALDWQPLVLLVDWFSSAGERIGLFNSFMFDCVGCLFTSAGPCAPTAWGLSPVLGKRLRHRLPTHHLGAGGCLCLQWQLLSQSAFPRCTFSGSLTVPLVGYFPYHSLAVGLRLLSL